MRPCVQRVQRNYESISRDVWRIGATVTYVYIHTHCIVTRRPSSSRGRRTSHCVAYSASLSLSIRRDLCISAACGLRAHWKNRYISRAPLFFCRFLARCRRRGRMLRFARVSRPQRLMKIHRAGDLLHSISEFNWGEKILSVLGSHHKSRYTS